MKLAATLLVTVLTLSAQAQTPTDAASTAPTALPGPTPIEDPGKSVPTADAIAEGLFPDDECDELIRAGFKCMGFKPATKYSLPASTLKVGSAELPAVLKQQLDAIAPVLKGREDNTRQVRIIGHADASGTDRANQTQSIKPAESVRDDLTGKGVDGGLLIIEGVGANEPKDRSSPKRMKIAGWRLGASSNGRHLGRRGPTLRYSWGWAGRNLVLACCATALASGRLTGRKNQTTHEPEHARHRLRQETCSLHKLQVPAFAAHELWHSNLLFKNSLEPARVTQLEKLQRLNAVVRWHLDPDSAQCQGKGPGCRDVMLTRQ